MVACVDAYFPQSFEDLRVREGLWLASRRPGAVPITCDLSQETLGHEGPAGIPYTNEQDISHAVSAWTQAGEIVSQCFHPRPGSATSAIVSSNRSVWPKAV